jgi:hypothetical protein
MVEVTGCQSKRQDQGMRNQETGFKEDWLAGCQLTKHVGGARFEGSGIRSKSQATGTRGEVI